MKCGRGCGLIFVDGYVRELDLCLWELVNCGEDGVECDFFYIVLICVECNLLFGFGNGICVVVVEFIGCCCWWWVWWRLLGRVGMGFCLFRVVGWSGVGRLCWCGLV